MRFRLQHPRQFAQRLRQEARKSPRDVEDYLDANAAQWEALVEADPHDAADILEELGPDAASDLIETLDPDQAGPVIEEMGTELAAELFDELDSRDQVLLLSSVDTDTAADILGVLDDDDRLELLALLPSRTAAEVRRLLLYPPDSAGGLMTTEVASLPVGLTAGEAIERLRRMNQELDDLSYVYVVDDDYVLVGVVSFRDLVFARPGTGLDETMIPEPMSVTPDADREAVSDLTQRYNLFGLPVVDAAGRLIGMVRNEAVIEAIRREASEDFAAAVGAGVEESVFSPIHQSVRMRLPWLIMNLVMALLVALVIERQSGIIEQHGVLAALMPVVALLGGNSGAQSLAVVIRGLASDQLPSSRVSSILGRQATVGALNSIPIGLLAAAIGATFGGIDFAIIMAVAIMANLTIASFAGAAIPLALRALGLDPALASNIFLTLLTDIIGFGGFLAVASILL